MAARKRSLTAQRTYPQPVEVHYRSGCSIPLVACEFYLLFVVVFSAYYWLPIFPPLHLFGVMIHP